VELLGGLAIVADALASAWLSGSAFAAMAIPAKNAVPIPMDLPIVDISYLSRFYPHGGDKRKEALCDHFRLSALLSTATAYES
jgi:hypothetical protein